MWIGFMVEVRLNEGCLKSDYVIFIYFHGHCYCGWCAGATTWDIVFKVMYSALSWMNLSR